MSKLIVTVGTFDVLHVDHINLFKKCREIIGPQGFVTVGVNTDEFVEEYKGRKPSMSTADRVELVRSIKYVDSTFENDDTSLDYAISGLSPDFLAIGSDWFAPGKDYMAQIGLTWNDMWGFNCMVVVVPSLERAHSSDFRKELS